MLFLSFVFEVFVSLLSSVATFNTVEGHAPHALHECHRKVHGKKFFKYSSVDRYRGRDFLNGS